MSEQEIKDIIESLREEKDSNKRLQKFESLLKHKPLTEEQKQTIMQQTSAVAAPWFKEIVNENKKIFRAESEE